jgi:hypothetical protein
MPLVRNRGGWRFPESSDHHKTGTLTLGRRGECSFFGKTARAEVSIIPVPGRLATDLRFST